VMLFPETSGIRPSAYNFIVGLHYQKCISFAPCSVQAQPSANSIVEKPIRPVHRNGFWVRTRGDSVKSWAPKIFFGLTLVLPQVNGQ
jgi:hypothetical protein